MSKQRTPVYLLIAALSLAVAVWQPRDAVAEHATTAIARMLEAVSRLYVAPGAPVGPGARGSLPVAPR